MELKDILDHSQVNKMHFPLVCIQLDLHQSEDRVTG